ncbi:MAG: hypothetical protein QOG87_489, partial [Actinomycetota bacterium]
MRLTTLPYVRRLVGWRLLVAAMAPVTVAVFVAKRLNEMHWTFLALSAGLAITLIIDDPAADTLASSPASLWRRRSLRLGVGLPAVVVATMPAAWYLHAHTSTRWADGGLEWAGTVAVALALATLALRRTPDTTASAVAAPLVLVAVALSTTLPERWAVHPVAGHRLVWLAAALAAACVVRLGAADPASVLWRVG